MIPGQVHGVDLILPRHAVDRTGILQTTIERGALYAELDVGQFFFLKGGKCIGGVVHVVGVAGRIGRGSGTAIASRIAGRHVVSVCKTVTKTVGNTVVQGVRIATDIVVEVVGVDSSRVNAFGQLHVEGRVFVGVEIEGQTRDERIVRNSAGVAGVRIHPADIVALITAFQRGSQPVGHVVGKVEEHGAVAGVFDDGGHVLYLVDSGQGLELVDKAAEDRTVSVVKVLEGLEVILVQSSACHIAQTIFPGRYPPNLDIVFIDDAGVGHDGHQIPGVDHVKAGVRVVVDAQCVGVIAGAVVVPDIGFVAGHGRQLNRMVVVQHVIQLQGRSIALILAAHFVVRDGIGRSNGQDVRFDVCSGSGRTGSPGPGHLRRQIVHAGNAATFGQEARPVILRNELRTLAPLTIRNTDVEDSAAHAHGDHGIRTQRACAGIAGPFGDEVVDSGRVIQYDGAERQFGSKGIVGRPDQFSGKVVATSLAVLDTVSGDVVIGCIAVFH